MGTKIKPRNDQVLCRMVKVNTVHGLVMPDIAQEGKQYVVEAIGPKVEDLKVGDKILASGTRGVNWDFLPGFSDLFIISEKNIPLTYVETVEEEDE